MSVETAKSPYKRKISDPPNGFIVSERAMASVDIIYSDMLTGNSTLDELNGVIIDQSLLRDGALLVFNGSDWAVSSVIDGGGP